MKKVSLADEISGHPWVAYNESWSDRAISVEIYVLVAVHL